MNLPLVGITLFFLSGILVGDFLPWACPWRLLLAAFATLIAAFILRRTSWFLFFLGLGFFLAGAFSAQRTLHIFPPSHISKMLTQAKVAAKIRGVVNAQPYRQAFRQKGGDSGRRVVLPLELEEINTAEGWQKTSGKVRIQVYRYSLAKEFEIGERLELVLSLRKLKEGGYGRYLRRQRILVEGTLWGGEGVRRLGRSEKFSLRRKCAVVRTFLEDKMVYGLSEREHRQILKGLVFGSRNEFTLELNQLFRRTNTYHVLAISGFNMMLVITLLTALLAAFRLPRRWVAGIMMAIVFIYMALVDWPPSATRAGLMSLLGLLAWAIDRDPLALNTVAASALLILLLSPMQLFLPGFQLSYIVVLGLVFWTQPLHNKLCGQLIRNPEGSRAKIVRSLSLAVAVSSIAWGVVLPIQLHLFGNFSPYSILTNLLILGFVSALTYLGLAALLFNLISVNFGIYLNEINALFMQGLIGILRFFEKLPGSYWEFPRISALIPALFYFAMLYILYVKMTPQRHDPV